MSETGEQAWFYNVRTKRVEHGRQSQWADLLGPYPTREDAERALATAEERGDSWDAEDERRREEDESWGTWERWED